MPSSAASALSAISGGSGAPTPIFSLSTGELPFTSMARVVQYLAAPATCTSALHYGVLVCGELIVSRLDGDLLKSYSIVYGVSSTGGTVYGGQFKGFPLHHMPSSCTAEAADFFGHNPLSPQRLSSLSGLNKV